MIHLKRAYDDPDPGDGKRFLVDRIWPRGVSKSELELDQWLREAAPSDELRTWFGHEPERWEEFRRRYRAELEGKTDSLDPILEMAEHADVTLVYGARDREHNNAVVLREYLRERMGGG